MSQDSFPFPLYSGLLEPEHYERIGNAIWLFLWCVSSTTFEMTQESDRWGVVLGSKPVEIDELAERFGVNRSTIKRWIGSLQDNGYIKTKRAPYGIMFFVRKSKKFNDNRWFKNEPDSAKMSHPEPTDGAKIDHPTCKNEPSNKDISSLKDVVVLDSAEVLRRSIEIERHFLSKRKKGFNIPSADLADVKIMMATGIPVEIVTESIDRSFAEYKPQHANDEIRSIKFCIPRCYSDWERAKVEQSITAAVPHVSVALGSPKRSKQQQQIDELDKFIQEASGIGNS